MTMSAIDQVSAEPNTAEAEAEQRRAVIQSVREFANFLEQHPTVKAPFHCTFNEFVSTKEQLAEQARLTTWEKCFEGDYFWLRKRFGEAVTLEINCHRSLICERIVVGTRMEPAK